MVFLVEAGESKCFCLVDIFPNWLHFRVLKARLPQLSNTYLYSAAHILKLVCNLPSTKCMHIQTGSCLNTLSSIGSFNLVWSLPAPHCSLLLKQAFFKKPDKQPPPHWTASALRLVWLWASCDPIGKQAGGLLPLGVHLMSPSAVFALCVLPKWCRKVKKVFFVFDLPVWSVLVWSVWSGIFFVNFYICFFCPWCIK